MLLRRCSNCWSDETTVAAKADTCVELSCSSSSLDVIVVVVVLAVAVVAVIVVEAVVKADV